MWGRIKNAFRGIAVWLSINLGTKSISRSSPLKDQATVELDSSLQQFKELEERLNQMWKSTPEYKYLCVESDDTLYNALHPNETPEERTKRKAHETRSRAVPNPDRKMIEYWENRAATEDEHYI